MLSRNHLERHFSDKIGLFRLVWRFRRHIDHRKTGQYGTKLDTLNTLNITASQGEDRYKVGSARPWNQPFRNCFGLIILIRLVRGCFGENKIIRDHSSQKNSTFWWKYTFLHFFTPFTPHLRALRNLIIG